MLRDRLSRAKLSAFRSCASSLKEPKAHALSPVLLVALYFSEIPCQGIFNVIGYNLIELNPWELFHATY
jgi:hypothetical protein